MSENELKRENITVIDPQPTETNPYVIDGYPYGFNYRTKKRYWIETTKRGDREVTQTLNPKTERWNKPKKSTYSDIVMLYVNNLNGHVESFHFYMMYSRQENLDKFLELFPEETLTEKHKKIVKLFRAILKARKHVKIKMVVNPTKEEQERIEKNEREFKEYAPKLVNYYLRNPEADLTQK